jgi:hypothetical protein
MMTMNFFRLKIAKGISLKDATHTGDESGGKGKGFTQAGFPGSRIRSEDDITNGAGGAMLHTNLLIMMVVNEF